MDIKDRTKEELLQTVEELKQEIDTLKAAHERNLAERLLSEKIIERTQLNFTSFFNTIDEYLFVLDEHAIITNINDTAVKRLGYKKVELIGQSIFILHPPERHAEVSSIMAKVLQGNTDLSMVPFVTKAGIQVPIEIKFSFGMWNNKPSIFGAAKDISALKFSEEKFSKLFMMNPSACGLSDFESYKFIEVNDAFPGLLGFKKHEVTGKTPETLGLFSQNNYGSIAEDFIGSSKISNKEAVLRAKNGDCKQVLVSAENIQIQDKVFRFSIFYDITELRKTTQELVLAKETAEDSEIRYKQLFDNSLDHIFIIDITKEGRFRVLDANPTQLSQKWALRKDHFIEDCLPPEETERVIANYTRCQKTRNIISYEEFIGGYHFYTQLIPIEDPNKVIYRIIGIARDITNKKNDEKKIKTLSKAIEQSPTSIMITDANGDIEYVNDKFLSFSQYSLEELKGRKPRIFNKGHLSPEDYNKMWETLLSGETWRGEFQNRTKDNNFYWENVTISPILDIDGSTSNYIISLVDVTERRKMVDDLIEAKEKAQESDRLKTAFLHNISHEIRTPMNAIVGFSGLLTDPEIDHQRRVQFTDIIVRSSDQLLSIINDIINIASIEAGQAKINESVFDLNYELDQLHEQFLLVANKQNISLNLVSLVSNEYWIQTDQTKLIQIITNLLVNALKFTKEGYVNFGYTEKQEEIEFFVEDTGIGIPQEYHDKIFQRFLQVEMTETRTYGGSGLGLSISKGYVELLGGKIRLKSQCGKGSIFYFTIPLNKSVPTGKMEKTITSNSNQNSGKWSSIPSLKN